MLQIQGTKVCLGVDALNEGGASLTRFVAPVTMLATGGAGQVTSSSCVPRFRKPVVPCSGHCILSDTNQLFSMS